jgi:hypothetical protein
MKKILLAVTLTLATLTTIAPKVGATGSADCDDFATQPEAQIFYINNMLQVNKGILDNYYLTLGYSQSKVNEIVAKNYDSGNLDADDNGLACEHLPGYQSFVNKESWGVFKYNIQFFKNLGLKELTVFFNTTPQFNSQTDARFNGIDGQIRVAPTNGGKNYASLKGTF